MLSVYNYEDPIKYINDYINIQKKSDEDFSIRKWSKSLDLKSTAPLLDVIQRRKPMRGKMFSKILSALPLDKSEYMYFQAITERSQSKSKEKTIMYNLIIDELRPSNDDESAYSCHHDFDLDLLSHWVYMAILSMVNLKDFELTANNIKGKLLEDLDLKVIEGALYKLFESGLIKRDENGVIFREHSSHFTKTDVKTDNVELYLSMVCDLAKKTAAMSVEDRELQCFSMAIDKKNLPLAKEIIRKARKQLEKLSEDENANVVYQTNLQMFPLTES